MEQFSEQLLFLQGSNNRFVRLFLEDLRYKVSIAVVFLRLQARALIQFLINKKILLKPFQTVLWKMPFSHKRYTVIAIEEVIKLNTEQVSAIRSIKIYLKTNFPEGNERSLWKGVVKALKTV